MHQKSSIILLTKTTYGEAKMITTPGKYKIKLCEGAKPVTANVIDQDGQLGIWFSISRIFTPLTDFKGLTVVEKLEG